MALSGFKSTGGSLGLAGIKLEATDKKDADPLSIIQRELGITYHDKRTNATILAFSNPGEAYKEYVKDRKPIDEAALALACC